MQGVPSWPANTEVREVILAASEQLPTQLLLLAAADKKRDAAAMRRICKEIRQIATRVEGYCRMKERQWRKGERKQNANPTSN